MGNGRQCIAGLDCVRFSSLGRRPRCHCRGILWEFREGRKFARQTEKMVQRGLNRFLSASSAFYVGCFIHPVHRDNSIGNHYMRTRIIDSLLGRSNDATKALRLGHPSLTTRGRPPPTRVANWVVDRCPPPPVCLFVCDFCTCFVFLFLSLPFPPSSASASVPLFLFSFLFSLRPSPCALHDAGLSTLPVCRSARPLATWLETLLCCAMLVLCDCLLVGSGRLYLFFFVVLRVCL